MRTTFLVLAFLQFSFISDSQTIKENFVDEFTKDRYIRSSWETSCIIRNFASYMRIEKINDSIYLNLKVMIAGGEVFSVSEHDQLMIKLSNDSLLTLNNTKFTITCQGCGAVSIIGSQNQGVHLRYRLNKEQLIILQTNTIKKVRFYFSQLTKDQFAECETEVKKSEGLKKMFNLL